MNIYEENGYASRGEYLDAMAEDYGLEKSDVRLLADLLGPSEDFDGDLWPGGNAGYEGPVSGRTPAPQESRKKDQVPARL